MTRNSLYTGDAVQVAVTLLCSCSNKKKGPCACSVQVHLLQSIHFRSERNAQVPKADCTSPGSVQLLRSMKLAPITHTSKTPAWPLSLRNSPPDISRSCHTPCGAGPQDWQGESGVTKRPLSPFNLSKMKTSLRFAGVSPPKEPPGCLPGGKFEALLWNLRH